MAWDPLPLSPSLLLSPPALRHGKSALCLSVEVESHYSVLLTQIKLFPAIESLYCAAHVLLKDGVFVVVHFRGPHVIFQRLRRGNS